MSAVHNLSAEPNAVGLFMRELRDVNTQLNKDTFRKNIARVGQAIAFEVSKSLSFSQVKIQTPLAAMQAIELQDQLVVVTILRAGLPLHNGILEVFPEAENGFISAYRKHHDNGSFDIEVEYVACPDLTDKVLILNDPMLATGRSFINAWNALLKHGTPKSVHLAAVIASEEGVNYVLKEAPAAFDLWVGAIDPTLNDQQYIVPGLGDAGDLSFGNKLQG